MKRTAWFSALAGLSAFTAGPNAAALDTTTLPARIAYATGEAATGCPSSEDFVAAVRERLRRGHLAEAQDIAREYRVSVRRVGDRYAARLDFTDPDGTARTREVGAEGCTDVSRAIALVTALAIDAAGAETTTGASDSEGLLTASEALGLVEPNASMAKPPPMRAAPQDVVPRIAYPEKITTPPGFDVGIRATLTSPKAPVVLPGAELFGRLAALRDAWLVELAIAGERGSRVASTDGSARFSFVGGRVRVCAYPFPLGGSFDAMPCAVAEAGALVAEGFIDNPRTRVTAWAAFGPAVRVSRRSPLGSLHVEAGPLFPTTRNHYIFGPIQHPDGTAHNVPAVGVFAALGGDLCIF